MVCASTPITVVDLTFRETAVMEGKGRNVGWNTFPVKPDPEITISLKPSSNVSDADTPLTRSLDPPQKTGCWFIGEILPELFDGWPVFQR